MTQGTPRNSSFLSWAYLVLLLVLLLTAVAAWSVHQLVRQQQEARFAQEVNAVTRSVQQRLDGYVEVMRSARGLWNASGAVSRNDFARYVDSLELAREYPGIQGLGYAEYLRPGERAAFEARLRAQGLPGFRVRPAAAGGVSVPVTYLEPRDDANAYALGFDMFSESARRAAIVQARDSGDAAATAPVTLVQDDRQATRSPGFLIYLPVYRAGQSLRTPSDRRAAVQGFIYAPFRADDFLAPALVPGRYGALRFTLSDGDQRLYGPPAPPAAYEAVRSFSVGGRAWTLAFAAPPGFGRDAASLTPWLTLLLGGSIAVLAFLTTQNQVLARERAEELSKRLARSRAEFEAIFRSMHDAAVFADSSGQVRLANDALTHIFGYTQDELRGRRLSILRADGAMVAPDNVPSEITTYRRKDGGEFVGEAQRSFVRSPSGEVIGQLKVVRDLTASLESQRALRESELRYRGVLEAMPQIVWVTDPEGRHLYYNEGWYAYTGLSVEDSLDYGFARALHPDDVARTLASWERSWKRGEPYEIEYRFRGRDGEYRWFVGRARPVRGEDGGVIEWVGTCTDIHERKQFEDALGRSEARYRGLVEGMPQIVWLADPRGRLTFFNRRYLDFVGAARAGEFGEDALHPEDREAFALRWARSVESGLPLEADVRLRREDGEYRTFAARGLPVRGAPTLEGGEIIEWAGSFTDIEDAVYAETTARLLAEVSRLLAAPLGSALMERGRATGAVLRLFTERFAESASLWLTASQETGPWEGPQGEGVPDDRVPDEQVQGERADFARLAVEYAVGPHVDQGVLIGSRAAAEELVARVIGSGNPEVVPPNETQLRAGFTSTLAVPLSARGQPPLGALLLGLRRVPDERDLDFAAEIGGRIATALDNQRLFVQAREAEREVKELNATLEARVEQRTGELREANRELEAFSYSVSHDLRTPLRHVVGFGDLLRKELDGKLDAKGARYLGIMTDAATRMSTLIDELLEFSRMGRQELRFEEVDLGKLVREVREELTRDRVTDAARPPALWQVGPLPMVAGDAGLLRLVFENLLSNALKYSRTREQSVISVTGREEGGEAVIEVRDNGVGFDARFQDKLFGVFQRLHRAEDFEGTGIGLANVRRIVTRHGGRAWAQSVLGEGAAFWVALPLAPQRVQEDLVQEDVAQGLDRAASARSGPTVQPGKDSA